MIQRLILQSFSFLMILYNNQGLDLKDSTYKIKEANHQQIPMSTLINILPSQLSSQIRSTLNEFTASQSNNTQQLHRRLSSIEIDSQQQITALNQFLQKQVKAILVKIMTAGDLQKVGQLIGLLCDLSREQQSLQHNQSNKKKQTIKQSLPIIIVEEVLECLGINDLKEILPIISQKLCSFKQLDIANQNRMLRIINHLLKRISKTEDYLIRGQLQFTLTKILSICHDSGFHYRIPTAKGIEIVEDQAQQFGNLLENGGITYQFYKDFWLLQKYLMDPNQLTIDQSSKSNNQQQSKKPTSIYKTQPLLSLRLKQIQKVLSQVISYMKDHPCSETSNSLLSQPIKFLTNTHLLEYQLSDPYFRKIILLQVIVFTFTLTQLKSVTNNILKGIMITQNDRMIIAKIDSMAQKYLQIIEKSQQKTINLETQIVQSSIFDMIKSFFANQLQWVDLKDNWKEKKKVFLGQQPTVPEPQKQKQNKAASKQKVDYNKKISQIQAKIAKQMNIQGDTLMEFLTQPCAPHIITAPTQTSFSYYWSQGKSCLQSFDFEKNQQKQFETRSEYNMYEWKALRSLFKDSIKDIYLVEKNPKLRQYKVPAYIELKEKHFAMTHKQAQPIQQTTPVSNGAKSTKLFVIEEATESKQVSKERKSLENQANQPNASSNNQQGNKQVDGSPQKKQKIQ